MEKKRSCRAFAIFLSRNEEKSVRVRLSKSSLPDYEKGKKSKSTVDNS